jgi:hypothetical protein
MSKLPVYLLIQSSKKNNAMRKLRTRQHIIEDLGFNHIERQILKAGFTVTPYHHNDYGLDGQFRTFNEKGEVEHNTIEFQLKSTDKIKCVGKTIKFDLSKRDLELWLLNNSTLLILLYDAQKEVAYFLDIQAYFQENRLKLHQIDKFIRVDIAIDNIFTPEAVLLFRKNFNQ